MAQSVAWITLCLGILLSEGAVRVSSQLYPYGVGVDTVVSLAGDTVTCIPFANVRILDSITGGTTALSDHMTSFNELCISPNGGVAFDSSTFSASYAAVTSGPAVLPLYVDYDVSFAFGDDSSLSGLFYSVVTDSTTLDSYTADAATCGLPVNDFKACWGVKVTWGNLFPQGSVNLLASTPTLTNTFQVVLLGNAGDAVIAIVNYDKVSSVADQVEFRGVSNTHDFTLLADPTQSNCAPAIAGRSVFFIGDNAPLDPSGSTSCDDAVDCGRYGDLVSTGGGSSGSCNTGVCTCATGYSGIYCLNDDVKDCDTDLCGVHTLLCEDTGLGIDRPDERYRCHCEDGWSGDLCDEEILACDSSPCQNGATCNNIPLEYSCTCADGWTGYHCDVDILECSEDPHPCLNGGTCNELPGSFECVCPTGVSGTLCECGPWGDWSTNCREPTMNWDGICGGCGEQFRTRTCAAGSSSEVYETRNCNVRSCQQSIYAERTMQRPGDSGHNIIAMRKCCYKFRNDGTPVKLSKAKLCLYVTNGLV